MTSGGNCAIGKNIVDEAEDVECRLEHIQRLIREFEAKEVAKKENANDQVHNGTGDEKVSCNITVVIFVTWAGEVLKRFVCSEVYLLSGSPLMTSYE